MSATHTPPAPAAAPDPAARGGEDAGPSRRRTALRWITGGTVGAAVIAAITVAVWPASETDKARADGERYGEAVSALYAADTPAEVDDALTDMRAALADTREHAGDAVAEQAADQKDALERAADGFVGAHTADDSFDREIYQTELDVAVDDLTSQASDFRETGPEVQQAFWDGVQTGLSTD